MRPLADIAEEIAAHAPRTAVKQQYLADIRGRLDRIFAGDEPVGPGPAVHSSEDDQPQA